MLCLPPGCCCGPALTPCNGCVVPADTLTATFYYFNPAGDTYTLSRSSGNVWTSACFPSGTGSLFARVQCAGNPAKPFTASITLWSGPGCTGTPSPYAFPCDLLSCSPLEIVSKNTIGFVLCHVTE